MPQERDPILTRYDALPRDEQKILQVLAVVYEPVTQTELKEILGQLRWPQHYLVGKSWRDRMIDLGLVEQKGGRLRASLAIANGLAYETVAARTFEDIMHAGLAVIPATSPFRHANYLPEAKQRRLLRNALFLQDIPAFCHYLDIKDPFDRVSDYHASLLADAALPVVPEWFEDQPDVFKYQILRPVVESQIFHGKATADSYLLLRRSVEPGTSHPALVAMLAELDLYRLDVEAVEYLLHGVEDYRALKVLGALRCLQGRYEEARTHFANALTAKRRSQRKRSVHIEGVMGWIYCLALVQEGDRTCAKALNQQTRSATRRYVEEYLDDAYAELDEFLTYWRAESSANQRFDIPDFDLDGFSIWYLLTMALINHWLDRPLPVELVAALEDRREEMDEASHAWLYEELGALIENSPVEGRAPLAELVKRLTTWERALQALLDLDATAATAAHPRAGQPESRVAWILERSSRDRSLKMTPREQKRQKNGSWSKGRAVSLKKLAETPDDVPCLTDMDRRICRCIRKDYYNRGYYLAALPGIHAAAGHPAVFWWDQPNAPVDVAARDPELHVTEEASEVLISIYPAKESLDLDDLYSLEASEHPDFIELETPGELAVYRFDKDHKKIAGILGREGLRVPLHAKDRVIESVTAISPILTVHSDLTGLGDGLARRIDADSRIHLYLHPVGQEIRVQIGVQPFTEGPRFLPGEGGRSVFAEIGGERLQAERDLEAEARRLSEVVDGCSSLEELGGGQWMFADLEAALEGLLYLQDREDVAILWPEGKKIDLRREVGVNSVSLSVRSKTDWFEVTGEITAADGEVLDMQKVLALMQDSPGRFIRLGYDEFIALTGELRRRLEQLGSVNTDGRVHPLAGFQLDEIAEGMSVTADRKWHDFRERIQRARELEPTLPTTFAGDLRDYQFDGYFWLSRLAAWGAGACLADDMGLGKTIQSLALLLSRAEKGPSLVVAPTSVCMNWVEECQRFTPTLRPLVFGVGDRAETIADLAAYDLVVCSYGLLASEATLLTTVQWGTVVADEAQQFKNANTRRSKAMMQLEADCRVITTGTPIENHLGELWNLFHFINEGLLGSLEEFNERFARPIENGDEQARQQLKNLISPFILRRLKRDVLKELPPRTDITLTVDLSREESALYEALRREALEDASQAVPDNQRRMIVLAQITRLRRAVCNPALVLPDVSIPSSKLQVFGELVEELMANGHRALVFSQFVGHLSLIREYLDDNRIDYQYLDGSTPAKQRRVAIDAFQGGDGALFLISLKAGGMGLNLTAADYVIHMDPWWNPAVEDQASDRAHRIGQQRPVTIYRLVAAETIEQKIVELHQHKRDLADGLLQGADIGARMTVEEIVALMS